MNKNINENINENKINTTFTCDPVELLHQQEECFCKLIITFFGIGWRSKEIHQFLSQKDAESFANKHKKLYFQNGHYIPTITDIHYDFMTKKEIDKLKKQRWLVVSEENKVLYRINYTASLNDIPLQTKTSQLHYGTLPLHFPKEVIYTDFNQAWENELKYCDKEYFINDERKLITGLAKDVDKKLIVNEDSFVSYKELPKIFVYYISEFSISDAQKELPINEFKWWCADNHIQNGF